MLNVAFFPGLLKGLLKCQRIGIFLIMHRHTTNPASLKASVMLPTASSMISAIAA